MGKSRSFFTLEDAKAAFNLFCCVYGVGTLGMPANFSRAGPVLAIIAMLFMAFANVYASVVCCRVMLVAPKSVRTFGDLGEWCMGKTGRWLVVVSQMGVCLLVPCVFLVLGGTLLPDLFPGTFKDTTWIILMALLVLPVVLIPTLKEGAGAAFAGCMGTLIADIIGVGVLLHGMSGHPSVPTPSISFKQVATTFGNLSLAYGAGIVIPALQRQHSEPERMPRVVGITMTFISCLFIALASSGYSAIGCQISGNLLFTIYPDATTGLSKLGFASDRGLVVLAFLFMQLHITIAFSVILHPALYLMERMFLGMHKHAEDDIEAINYDAADTPADEIKIRNSKGSVVSMADIEKTHDNEEDESAEYKGHELKYIPMRIITVALMTAVSIALKKHFSDLQDFVGASCIALSCIILPIVFYFKKLWTTIPMWEKVLGSIVVVICFVLGCYVTYNTGKTLFNPDDVKPTDPVFPFCHKEHQFEVYYNYTRVHHG
jgi:solute carrier family 32 (vesicular inhibitory amino acid transporter)